LRPLRQQLTDLAHLAVGTGCDHFGHADSANHQRARVDKRRILPTWSSHRVPWLGRRPLADWNGFAGQQGFVSLQITRIEKQRVSRYAVALRQDNYIAPYDFAAGNPLAHAVPNDERARA
jgi:hypothetical protein